MLAQKSGVSPVTIGQIETGKRNARHQTLRKLMDGLGLTESTFFGQQEGYSDSQAGGSGINVSSKSAASENTEGGKAVPLVLSNLDLEIINRVLNLSFDGKLTVVKYLNNLD